MYAPAYPDAAPTRHEFLRQCAVLALLLGILGAWGATAWFLHAPAAAA